MILFENKVWAIEKISEGEIKISNMFRACYAYISEDQKTLMFDTILCPKYIQRIALKLAQKNIISIYN